jgi:hypothetical protein
MPTQIMTAAAMVSVLIKQNSLEGRIRLLDKKHTFIAPKKNSLVISVTMNANEWKAFQELPGILIYKSTSKYYDLNYIITPKDFYTWQLQQNESAKK